VKLKSLLIVLFMALLTVATACSKDAEGDSDVVKLSFWDFHTEAEKEYFQGLVDEYNKIQDDVKIEMSSYNQSDYVTTTLPVAFANGEGPDIFMVSPPAFQKFSTQGILADLTPYFTEETKGDFLPSALEAVTVDDKIYALPFELELLGLYYNKKMLADAGVDVPKTWDELYEAAKKLQTDDVAGIVLPTMNEPYLNFIWYPFMWQNGGDVLSEDGTKSTFNSPEVAEALDFYGKFFKEGLAPSQLQMGPTEIQNLGEGLTAMQIVGTWSIPVLERDYPDLEVGLAPIPIPEGGVPATDAGGWKMAVNANSKHVEEAAKFVMWAFADDPSRPLEWVTEVKFAYSPRQSVIEAGKDFYDKGLRSVFTNEIYDSAIPEPKYDAEIVNAIGEALQNVMFSDMTGQEAAEIAHKAIQSYLDSK
jgi:multiple sugar transport system substrate-binding protein